MLYISTKYKLADGEAAPEETIELTCSRCGAKFAVPADDMPECPNVCEECGPALEAEIAAKEATNAATQSEIDKALGK